MKSPRVPFVVWTAYVVAWTVPVVSGGITLPDGLPGWEAFRVAASPVWPYDGVKYETWYLAALAVASAASNFLMIATPWLLTRHKRSHRRAGAAAAAAAFLVNAQWIALYDGRKDLRVGYYLWWLSFLGIAWFLWRRDVTGRTATERAAA